MQPWLVCASTSPSQPPGSKRNDASRMTKDCKRVWERGGALEALEFLEADETDDVIRYSGRLSDAGQ